MNYYEKRFFLEQYPRKGNRFTLLRKLDEEEYFLFVAREEALLVLVETFFAEGGNDPFTLEGFLGRFLEQVRRKGLEPEGIFARLDREEEALEYLNLGMPPILVKNRANRLVALESSPLPEAGTVTLSRFPLEQINTLLMVNEESEFTYLKKRFLTSFSKKELEEDFRRFFPEETLPEGFAFIFLNHEVSRHLKYTRYETIPAHLADLEAFEEGLEGVLSESLSDDPYLNSNTLLVFHELALNALEHGVLGIGPEEKQKRMEEGTYETWLFEKEKEARGTMEISLGYYDNRVLRIGIKDSGQGFDHAAYIRQLENVGANYFRGRGLLMALQLTNAIFYLDRGNEVVFFIRYRKDEARPVPEEEGKEASYLNRMTLLYVEDETTIRDTFVTVAQRIVNRVLVAQDGEEGLEMFRRHRPDMVVTDVEMPKLNGLEMASRIKEIDPEVPVVVTTAYNSESFFLRAIDAGVDKFVIKPIDMIKFREVLHHFSRIVHHRKENKRRQAREEERKEALLSDLKAKNSYTEGQQKAAFRKQQLIIADESERPGAVDSQVFYKPMEILSGDIYGVKRLDENRIFVYIIDGMGKGLPASVTAILSAAFVNRSVELALERDGFDLERLIESYTAYIRNYFLEEECLSMVMLQVDEAAKIARYAGFGMYPLLVKDRDGGSIVPVPGNNPPFTLYLPDFTIDTLTLPERFTLLAYSDGFVESDYFSLERLKEVLAGAENLDGVLARFREAGEAAGCALGECQEDDLTMIYLEN